MALKIPQRSRILITVEGEGDQSFIKWLNQLTDEKGLHIHLDCKILRGGGYKSMLKETVEYNKKRKETKGTPKHIILLVDSDRADLRHDGWKIATLKEEAAREKITICLQRPNQEGLLLRLCKENERNFPDANAALSTLCTKWRGYQKPVDARTLATKFQIEDLLRAANADEELYKLLEIIGFYSDK